MDETTRRSLEPCMRRAMPPHDPSLDRYFLEVEDLAREELADLAAASDAALGVALTVGSAEDTSIAAIDPCDGMPFPPLLACCVRLDVVLGQSLPEIAGLVRQPLAKVLEMMSYAGTLYILDRGNPKSLPIALVIFSRRQEWRWQ